jgi:predicted phage-related endonuclease
MKTFNMPQGSKEWESIRRGVVTASEIDALITPEWKPRTGEGVKTYLYNKIAEKLMAPDTEDEDVNTTPSWAADQGKILENTAIPWFEFETDLKVERVGFCLSDDGRIGCSPDGLVGDDAGLETKCPQPHYQVRYLLGQAVPKQYLGQVHMSMLVTGRPCWWFVSYSQNMPKLIVKVERDEAIQEKLRDVIDAFLGDFDREFEKVREFGQILVVK